MEEYRSQVTEVYDGPRVMTDVQYPNAQMGYQKEVVYEEEDGHRRHLHHHHNPEKVVMAEVERIVEKPRYGYGEAIYEDVEAARYAQSRPTGYGVRHRMY